MLNLSTLIPQLSTASPAGVPHASPQNKLDGAPVPASLGPCMIIKPRVRGFVCITAHPQGCAAHVQEWINHVKAQGPIKNGPKKVLVIGASTGYGLASRI